jgi:Fur family ferric uptake transcriptional regulator
MKTQRTPVTVESARLALRAVGLRSTAARIAVLQRLADSTQPLSHQDVVDMLGAFGFDQSTVYRALQELADAGLLSRLDLGDQIRRFEYRSAAGDAEMEHPHFMCIDCGSIACLDDFSFQLTPSRGPRRAQLGEITEVLLKGHCGACQAG